MSCGIYLGSNAREFRCEPLRRGCEQYGMGIDYRPVRTPHYSGHIGRLIGTMMGKGHLLPGTTFSDVRGAQHPTYRAMIQSGNRMTEPPLHAVGRLGARSVRRHDQPWTRPTGSGFRSTTISDRFPTDRATPDPARGRVATFDQVLVRCSDYLDWRV
jgi:hypothetical protein